MSSSHRKTALIRAKVLIYLSMSIGLAAISLALISLFDFEFLKLTGAEKVIISLLGLLLVALGIEHLEFLTTLTDHIPRLEQSLNAVSGGVLLNNWTMVYDVAAELVRNAEYTVKATSLGPPDTDSDQRKKYYDALAQRAKELEISKRRNLTYKVIIPGYRRRGTNGALQNEQSTTKVRPIPSQERMRELLERRRHFQDAGVTDGIRLYTVEAASGVNLLVVDERHVVLGFSSTTVRGFMIGILFRDNPLLARQISEWYEGLTDSGESVPWSMVEKLAGQGDT